MDEPGETSLHAQYGDNTRLHLESSEFGVEPPPSRNRVRALLGALPGRGGWDGLGLLALCSHPSLPLLLALISLTDKR